MGQAATAQLGLEQIATLQPDVAILDVRLPDGSGIEVCREIRSAYPQIACLMLTSYADDEALFSAIMAGAAGYVLKEIGGSDLIGDIRRVSQGQSLIDANLSKDIFDRLRKTPKDRGQALQPLGPGTTGPRPDRPGSFQPSDRRRDLPGRKDRQELRVESPLQARNAATDRGRGLRGHPGRAPGGEPRGTHSPRRADPVAQSGSNSMPALAEHLLEPPALGYRVDESGGIVVDRHRRTQRQQDPVMVELTRQILRHHMLLQRGATMQPQPTLLQIGDELLLRRVALAPRLSSTRGRSEARCTSTHLRIT